MLVGLSGTLQHGRYGKEEWKTLISREANEW